MCAPKQSFELIDDPKSDIVIAIPFRDNDTDVVVETIVFVRNITSVIE